jgi:hypothetical protein
VLAIEAPLPFFVISRWFEIVADEFPQLYKTVARSGITLSIARRTRMGSRRELPTHISLPQVRQEKPPGLSTQRQPEERHPKQPFVQTPPVSRALDRGAR